MANSKITPNRKAIKDLFIKGEGKTPVRNILLQRAGEKLGLKPGENLANLGQWLHLRPQYQTKYWKYDDIIRIYYLAEVLAEEENDFIKWSLTRKPKKQSV